MTSENDTKMTREEWRAALDAIALRFMRIAGANFYSAEDSARELALCAALLTTPDVAEGETLDFCAEALAKVPTDNDSDPSERASINAEAARIRRLAPQDDGPVLVDASGMFGGAADGEKEGAN